jgi:hypothetical protein
MGNARIALQIISGLLTVIGQASTQLQAVNAILTKAQAEGRDITDAELAEIQVGTDAAVKEALGLLRGTTV